MKERIKEIIERKYGSVRRKRHKITLDMLEQAVKESFEYLTDYDDVAGGFPAFQSGITELVDEEYLKPIIKKKKYKFSYLDEAYWLSDVGSSQPGWSEAAMMRLMDAKALNLDYYRNHPEAQTAETWRYIERIYHFLRTAESRETITREERSLELFDQEKFLSEPEGRQFLNRLGMKLETLRAVIVREAFEYYRMPERPVWSILISENHSYYVSAKRLMMNGQPVCGLQPDMLIYGEGWKIISSLLYLEELGIEPLEAELLYAGDMDKTGWEIYGNLKLSYPELNVKLAIQVYDSMFREARQSYDYKKEQKECPPLHLELMRQEASAVPGLLLYIDTLLRENKRLPQEVLNYEVMVRLAGNELD